MKYIVSIMSGILLNVGIAVACDDHVGKCKVDAWRHIYTPGVDMLMLEGSSTCDKGHIRIRLYDTEKFIGVSEAFIEGHAFQAVFMGINEGPKSASIKYGIKP